jgi:hypothetical protein
VLRELSDGARKNRYFDAAFERFAAFPSEGFSEALARRFVQGFVTLMQAQLLLGAAAGSAGARAVAEAFCATRLNPDAGWGAVFGAGSALSDAGVAARARLQGVGLDEQGIQYERLFQRAPAPLHASTAEPTVAAM